MNRTNSPGLVLFVEVLSVGGQAIDAVSGLVFVEPEFVEGGTYTIDAVIDRRLPHHGKE